MKFLLSLLVAFGTTSAFAAEIFVEDTIVQTGASQEEASTAYELVRSSVTTAGRDTVTDNLATAEFVLQPKLMKLGDSYVLTVERRRGEEIVYASQVKASSLADLDRAARRATIAALSGPAPSATRSAVSEQVIEEQNIYTAPPVASTEATTTTTRERYDITPGMRPEGYWSLGIGPSFGRRLGTDDVFYNFAIGRNWDIDPRASVKLIGEAAFSTGSQSASLINFGGGASWFFAHDKNGSAYVTGDLGFGFANTATDESADGFSFGAGVGYQFFRMRSASLDAQLRYQAVMNETDGEGFPRLIGARVAVNF